MDRTGEGIDASLPAPLRRRRRRWPFVLAGVLVLVAAAGAAAFVYAGSQVERATIEGLAAPDGPDRPAEVVEAPDEPEPTPLPAVMNVLLVGLDSREGLTEEERVELSSGGDVEGARADTIILAQLRTDGSAGALLSFPRDLRVTRCDGSVGRINGAYEVGQEQGGEGGSCLVRTVSEVSGIDVHHYVELDFAGFVEVIDALGGVELCLDEPLHDRKAGLDLDAGCQHVDSDQALAFARARSIDDDFGRMERQQQLLRALLDETTAGGLGSDLGRTVRVLREIRGALRADDGLGFGTMRDLATGMRGLDSDHLLTYHVPADPQTIGGVAYVVEREAEADDLYEQFRDGTVLAQAGASAN